MKCPVDNETLVMADRNGVEIDYCPKCRGVWLDRGELDKIIDRASEPSAPADRSGARAAPPPPPPRNAAQPVYQPEPRRYHDDEDDHDGRPRRKRREGFLGDIFDF